MFGSWGPRGRSRKTSRHNDPLPPAPFAMIISRLKAGWLMIGGSILVFALADMLPESQIALAGLENVLFLLSINLMIIGIYFVKSSKPCPSAKELARRNLIENIL